MEPAAGAEEFFSERRTEAGPGAEQELAAAVEECAEETQREEEARGVEELLGAAAELQHVVAAEREQRRIEQCQGHCRCFARLEDCRTFAQHAAVGGASAWVRVRSCRCVLSAARLE